MTTMKRNFLTRYKNTLFKWFNRRKIEIKDNDLSPLDYDMEAINSRVYQAMSRTGKTRFDLAALFGMDIGLPLAMQPPEKLPRPTMSNMCKVAQYLGVSLRWVLHGEPENDVDFFVMSSADKSQTPIIGQAAHGAAVITGATNSTVFVQNIKNENASEIEYALLRSIRRLKPKDQAAAISFILALENEDKETRPDK